MRVGCAVFCLLIWLLTAVFLYNHWQDEQQKRLAESNVLLATTYRASVVMYRLSTEILFTEVIQRPEVIATFAEGVLGDGKTRSLARGKLYRLLAPAYVQLKERGIQQFQFHTASGHSFLRFHAPDKFDDPLFDIRPSVLVANTQKRPAFGFEPGRISAGFRYVFPLFRGAQHLGSVEAGVTFRKINEAMAEIDPEREYLMMIRRSSLERALFREQLSLYTASQLNEDFLVEDSALKIPGSPLPPSTAVKALNARLKGDPRVESGMRAGQPFSLAATGDNADWSISFEPINDLLGSNVAYVIAYAKAPYLTGLRQDFALNLFFATLTLGGLFWLTLRLLKAHDTLRQEKQRLQTVTDTIGDGLFVMDREGGITLVNPAFTQILGYPADEVLGKIGHKIFHVHGDGTQYAPVVECPIVKATRQGTEYVGEELFQHQDGRLLTVDIACKPIIETAFLSGAVIAFRDITERKATEEQLRETARLKSEFLANMSHEFRTPMTVFMAAIEHLQSIEQDAEHRQLLELAEQSSQRLYTLVNEILDFSKLEAKKLVIDKNRFSLRECLNEIVALMTVKARSKQLRLELEIAPEVRDTVEGDKYRLGQVLINLIDNAVKFTSEGGVTVAIRSQGNLLEFAVSDTGIGIPEDKLETIFEMFTQVDGSSTRRFSGTGLGLSITRKLIELMGGSISVRSRPGEGSVFIFTLPEKCADSTASSQGPDVHLP